MELIEFSRLTSEFLYAKEAHQQKNVPFFFIFEAHNRFQYTEQD